MSSDEDGESRLIGIDKIGDGEEIGSKVSERQVYFLHLF